MSDFDYEKLDAAIAELGLTYGATFVPQSQSRNAGEKEPTLNWRVAISRGGITLATDYMQGIGHVPGYPQTWGRRTIHQQETLDGCNQAAETGTYPGASGASVFAPRKPLPAPLLRDVLYCLVSDASVLDSGGFEDWARDYGYDTDSRKAEAVYRACLETALKLRALIGDVGIARLQELFQGY